MKKPTFLQEDQVLVILDRLKNKVPHRLIAEEFDISKKTVSRINTAEAWRDVVLRYRSQSPSDHMAIPNPLLQLAPAYCDLLDEITSIKNHFGLDFKQPIYWGWFDSWDGKHSIASDGFIIWESSDLVAYAKRLIATGVQTDPIWASKAEELPTFELEDIMSLPVGACYVIDRTVGDIVCMRSPTQKVFLRQKYVSIASRMKLDIREAGDSDLYVYLTRNKPKAPNDPMPIVIACAVTIPKEEML